jgi:hypothetical protein
VLVALKQSNDRVRIEQQPATTHREASAARPRDRRATLAAPQGPKNYSHFFASICRTDREDHVGFTGGQLGLHVEMKAPIGFDLAMHFQMNGLHVASSQLIRQIIQANSSRLL